MVNLTYTKFLLIILLTLPSFCFAQAVYDGQVLNKSTEIAIPNVNVTLLKQKTATPTNIQGYFRLITETPLPDDTLVFSSVGYQTYRLAVSAYQKQMFILLEAVNNKLNEVNINANKAKTISIEKFGYYDIKDIRGRWFYGTYPYHTVGLFAKQFQAPTAGALLNTIKLGRRVSFDIPADIDDYPKTTSSNTTRFLVHVMTIDSLTGAPDKKIFSKEVNLKDNSLMITLDLTKERTIIPDKKFFVAVEWLLIPLNEVVTLGIGEKIRKFKEGGENETEDVSRYTIIYQPFLVVIPRQSKVPTWTSKDGIKWDKIKGSEIALSATITY
jgi:hypothetical protein